MTEFLLRSITKGKFEEWHPESFSSLDAVCEQVEDWGNRTGDDVPELMQAIEISIKSVGHICPAYNVTAAVRDMLSDREREREESNKERFQITASGRTRKL